MDKTIKIPATMYREAHFERASVCEADRTVELSISSDEPYKRFFGTEILDHSTGAINMGRLKSGAQLLFNHDRNIVLGKILEATTDGKRLRVKAQIAENSKAQDLWPDIKSGVISQASVGYAVRKMVLEEEKGDDCTYRVTEWEPYEGSLVTIPADYTVGVGRSAERGEVEISVKKIVDAQNPHAQSRTMNEGETPKPEVAETPETPAPAPAETPAPAPEQRSADELAQYRSAIAKINGYVAAIKDDKRRAQAREIAAKHIEQRADFNDFREEFLTSWERAVPLDTPKQEPGSDANVMKRSAWNQLDYIKQAEFVRNGGKLTD